MSKAKIKLLAAKAMMFGRVYMSSAADFLLYMLGVPAAKPAPPGGNSIVYLGGNLPPRIARIVKWHKKQEAFYSILVCHREGFKSKYSNPSFDRVILFRNAWHLRRVLRSLGPVRLIHAFGPKSFYPAVAGKAVRTPFIYDMQDVLVVYYGLEPSIRWYRHELPHERYILSRADGIVSHSLEFQEAYRRYGLSKPPNLFFPLCCDDDVFEKKQGSFNPAEFHVVYVGEVAGSFRDSRQFATIQFHHIAESFARQGIHLHLYPAPGTFRADVDEYRQLSQSNRFLHVHEPVHQSQLARELSSYDFGLIPFFFRDTMHSWEKFKYSTSLKLFNFVEAGIPVIVSRDIVFQSWIVERYGMGLSIEKTDIDRMRKLISGIRYDELLKNIEGNRKYIALSNHIDRLVSFYSGMPSGI